MKSAPYELKTVDSFEEISTNNTSNYEYLDRDIVWQKVTVNVCAIVLVKPGFNIGYGHRKSTDEPWPHVMEGNKWVEVWMAGNASVKMLNEAFEAKIHSPVPRRMEEEEGQ